MFTTFSVKDLCFLFLDLTGNFEYLTSKANAKLVQPLLSPSALKSKFVVGTPTFGHSNRLLFAARGEDFPIQKKNVKLSHLRCFMFLIFRNLKHKNDKNFQLFLFFYIQGEKFRL